MIPILLHDLGQTENIKFTEFSFQYFFVDENFYSNIEITKQQKCMIFDRHWSKQLNRSFFRNTIVFGLTYNYANIDSSQNQVKAKQQIVASTFSIFHGDFEVQNCF